MLVRRGRRLGLYNMCYEKLVEYLDNWETHMRRIVSKMAIYSINSVPDKKENKENRNTANGRVSRAECPLGSSTEGDGGTNRATDGKYLNAAQL